MATSGVFIREARTADSPLLNRICLLTGDAGTSAEHLHTSGELIGLVYAEPYVHLPTGFGFVMVDPAKDDAVVGYALSTYNTRAFEQAALDAWYPRVRAKYAYPPDANEGATDADKRYINILHNPSRAPQAAVDFSPAHMHIDILPEYQRQGWGRRLIARVVVHLREERGLEKMWLGLDPRNDGAKRFYEALGFKELPGAPDGTMGLDFKDFRG
ncbi:acyl-CoA N-acyltransferase [Lentinus tigrinus ALCF2SS1-7]|uniref:Acyl-CoA N-acyltransferase n=1 Tax=Lentinus tigrinus ALCF2SS1-6 TaxID=1328759 RepID=A0A5C2STY2_9APHY|nr:acyl-CoA N-acyltransferase [Lentinus tigrinus ALCF2SS1-6]RPD81054.1 acyl-CoA N-acyltransferase [Lentinus tigrinus ALCF2SS1-7]